MKSITKTLSLLIISILTINYSFAQWSEDANNIWNTISSKSIGIGTTTPQTKLDIRGTITAGDNPSTGGSTILQGLYGSGALNNLGGVRSSGGTYLSYGVNQNGSDTWLSTTPIPIARSIAVLDDGFRVYTVPSQTIAIGTPLNVPPTEVFTIANNGSVGIGTVNPTEKLTVNGAIRVTGQPIYFLADHSDANYLIQSGAWDDGMKYKHWTSHQFFTNGVERVKIAWNGNVGIGVSDPKSTLTVNGTITAKKIQVTQTGWADYVFDKDYKLMHVDSLSAYIKTNKHLPEMPTTKDVEKNGVDVGNNQVLLLKKIEELTLYILQQNERIQKLEKEKISK